MIVDSGAPMSIVSDKCLDKYIEGMKVDREEIEKKICLKKFRFGENVYISIKEVMLPLIIRVQDGTYIMRRI